MWIGGSSGIGLATARLARAQGAEVILAARNPQRLEQAAHEVGARSTAASDAVDPAALDRFFADLPKPVDIDGGQQLGGVTECLRPPAALRTPRPRR